MNDFAAITGFFGWMTVINVVILALAGIMVMVARDWMIGMHSRMMGIDSAQLPRLYFQYLANFKIAALVFSLTPYIALKIMA